MKEKKPVTKIHVDPNVVQNNMETGKDDPVLVIRTKDGMFEAHELEIKGPSKLVYKKNRPLPGGTRVWIETTSEVKVIK